LPVQLIGEPNVVIIQESDPLADGNLKRPVSRSRHAALRLADEPDLITEGDQLLHCIIRRPIIDDYDFTLPDPFAGARYRSPA
jgi:hypothetical protein